MATVIAPPRTIHYVTTSGSGCVMYNINDPQEELILRREESGWGAFELEERTSSGGEKWLVIPGTTWGRAAGPGGGEGRGGGAFEVEERPSSGEERGRVTRGPP